MSVPLKAVEMELKPHFVDLVDRPPLEIHMVRDRTGARASTYTTPDTHGYEFVRQKVTQLCVLDKSVQPTCMRG